MLAMDIFTLTVIVVGTFFVYRSVTEKRRGQTGYIKKEVVRSGETVTIRDWLLHMAGYALIAMAAGCRFLVGAEAARKAPWLYIILGLCAGAVIIKFASARERR